MPSMWVSITEIKSNAQLEGDGYGEISPTKYMAFKQSYKSDRWRIGQGNQGWEKKQAKKSIPGRGRIMCKGPGGGRKRGVFKQLKES